MSPEREAAMRAVVEAATRYRETRRTTDDTDGMKPTDVPPEWARTFMAALMETGKPCEVNTGSLYVARAALATEAPDA